MTDYAVLGSLFVTALIAATIFPAQSEALLATLVIKTDIALWLLIAVASIGNIVGSCLNWVLGFYVEKLKHHKWFPVKESALIVAQTRYRKYGRWSLLLSWVPIIGDPITVMAGVMKERFVPFLIIVTIAKVARYVFIGLSAQLYL